MLGDVDLQKIVHRDIFL